MMWRAWSKYTPTDAVPVCSFMIRLYEDAKVSICCVRISQRCDIDGYRGHMVLRVVGGNCIILNAWSGSINGHNPGTT